MLQLTKKKCKMFGTKLQMSLQITVKQLCETISITLENDRKNENPLLGEFETLYPTFKKNDLLVE